ncbi:hypothetical protein [Anaerotignum sp.]
MEEIAGGKRAHNFHYRIVRIDEEERWIFISSDCGWDLDEPDSFCFLLKKIGMNLETDIIEMGDMQYKFLNAPLNFIISMGWHVWNNDRIFQNSTKGSGRRIFKSVSVI